MLSLVVRFILISISCGLLLTVQGCDKHPRPQKGEDAVEAFVHTVKFPGETLSIISHWYTGKGSNWRQLLAANPRIKNPSSLKAGTEVEIPGKLLKRRKALTREGLNNYLPKERPSQTKEIPTVKAESTATEEAKKVEEQPTQTPESTTTLEATVTETPAPTATPFPEPPTPSPDEIKRDSIIDEILSES